jgi:hypothetical protein
LCPDIKVGCFIGECLSEVGVFVGESFEVVEVVGGEGLVGAVFGEGLGFIVVLVDCELVGALFEGD